MGIWFYYMDFRKKEIKLYDEARIAKDLSWSTIQVAEVCERDFWKKEKTKNGFLKNWNSTRSVKKESVKFIFLISVLEANLAILYIFFSNFLHLQKAFFSWRKSLKIGIQNISCTISLQKITFCACDLFRHFFKIFQIVNSTNNRTSKFIIWCHFFDNFDAFGIRANIRNAPDQRLVFFPRMLDIHRHIIQQIFFEQILNYLWTIAIGIKFYQKTHIFDFSDKIFQIFMNRRFPATNRNSFKNSLPFFEKLKKIFRLLQAIFNLTNFFWQNKFTIVTISASKIAPKRENNTRYTPGEI